MAAVFFQCGARKIPAPLPGKSLQENVNRLMQSFPFFRFTTVLESDAVIMEDKSIVYKVEMPPAKTNG